ncbi:flagellar hook-basal body complex protein FliE [Jannaschia ovalis]|uniref:Flagellar hook-basal body complex protein FliE n=1 Tax=Jannaschia ovalis TaxID=3038773 RepID=A0ABY8LFW3_9RHOB|nr:flagellar hook-basal body complex protein FliE [Jannaschia sp. GRR-S6-38]WGH80182.1 flagellar hook-basal body complex protein FliE [Jannaschia sp. GRR-S6-38]
MDLTQISAGIAGAPSPAPAPTLAAAEAARGFAETLALAETQAQAALTGAGDPHRLVTAMAEGKLAVDTVVTIRDRVVEAYQEILRMPV